MKYTVCIFFVMYTLSCFGNLNDDTTLNGGMRIKGIDFRYGFGGYNLTERNELGLAKKLTNDQNEYYQFDKGHFNSNSGNQSDLYLGMVFVPDYYIKKRLFYREEFRFGVSYTFLNTTSVNTIKWDTTQTAQEKEVHFLDYQYKYHSERLHFSYLLNSKITKKNLAGFIGLGCSFGFVTWRTNIDDGNGIYRSETFKLDNTKISGYSKVIPLNNFSTESFILYLPVGIKYNLSCDINLFAEAHLGYQYYIKAFGAKGNWVPSVLMNFGFRYKLIDDDVVYKSPQAFW